MNPFFNEQIIDTVITNVSYNSKNYTMLTHDVQENSEHESYNCCYLILWNLPFCMISRIFF